MFETTRASVYSFRAHRLWKIMQFANTGKNTGMSAQRIARFLIPAAKEEKHLIKARGICAREHTDTVSSGGP